jgi:hypothetical protein
MLSWNRSQRRSVKTVRRLPPDACGWRPNSEIDDPGRPNLGQRLLK